MFKYLLLHIPSGNYVHVYDGPYAHKVGGTWVKAMRHKEYIWGWDIPEFAKRLEFDSKRRVKLWLRQRSFRVDKNEFELIEIIV